MDDNDKTLVIDQSQFDNLKVGRNSSNNMSKMLDQIYGKVDEDIKPGTIIAGKYRVLTVLGRTYNSAVYVCHPLDNLQVRYVLKQLKKSSQISQRRFKREADLYYAIKHENIVQMLEHFDDVTGYYIVLEYIDGTNLEKAVNDFNFDEQTILIIGKEVAKALQYAWDNFQLIHRDIKPANIMIDSAGHIKLLDFGISKSLDLSEGTELTMTSTTLGTPGYMSPEQFSDARNVQVQSDIFSLGATLCYLLLKEPPFKGKSITECYGCTCKMTPPDFLFMRSDLSSGFVQLISWMMQPDWKSRPEDWHQVLSLMRRLIK
jgi:serine/threonine protein kinase